MHEVPHALPPIGSHDENVTARRGDADQRHTRVAFWRFDGQVDVPRDTASGLAHGRPDKVGRLRPRQGVVKVQDDMRVFPALVLVTAAAMCGQS
jgi:hypothetical protein